MRTHPPPSNEMAEAVTAYRALQAEADSHRLALYELIRREVATGRATQADAARHTGWTREHIRRIVAGAEDVEDPQT